MLSNGVEGFVSSGFGVHRFNGLMFTLGSQFCWHDDEVFGGYDGAVTPSLLIFQHMSIDSLALVNAVSLSWPDPGCSAKTAHFETRVASLLGSHIGLSLLRSEISPFAQVDTQP
jgi:hypothetical protein